MESFHFYGALQKLKKTQKQNICFGILYFFSASWKEKYNDFSQNRLTQTFECAAREKKYTTPLFWVPCCSQFPVYTV